MMKKFTGPFGTEMNRHLSLRRSMGFLLNGAEVTLGDFDRFTGANYPKSKRVTREIVVAYLTTTKHLHSTSRNDRVTNLRQFCRFLFHLDSKTYIPERGLVPPAEVKIRAHIYDKKQVNEILKIMGNLKPCDSLRPHTYTTLIALLWVSGLRISEALKLNIEDVDLDTGIIHIRQTKFFKSRLVPLTSSTVAALKTYRVQRVSHGHDAGTNAPFFVNEWGRRSTTSTVQHAYADLMKQNNILTLQGRTPRLHDFRHSFATHYLAKLYQLGNDPTASLPILATYLGHANIANTQVYLHPSMDLLRTASRRFEGHCCQKSTTKPSKESK